MRVIKKRGREKISYKPKAINLVDEVSSLFLFLPMKGVDKVRKKHPMGFKFISGEGWRTRGGVRTRSVSWVMT